MALRTLVPPDPVAVLGAGNMGSGIAQAAAQVGYRVRLRDLDDAMLARGRSAIERTLDGAIQRGKSTPAKKQAILDRIEFTTDVAKAVEGAHLVVEAIFEEEPLKLALFAEVAKAVPDDAIVATNTSSLSVTRLGAAFPHPERFAGLHFFYPAAINKLLEVIGGERTSPEALGALTAFGYRLRKIPIEVRDAPGFAVNRFFVPYLNEAARLLEDDVASMATIEEVGREVYGTTLGPFELMNVTGIPIAFHSITTLSKAFGGAYAPSPRLKAQFEAKAPWAWKETRVEPDRKAAVRERFLGLSFGIAARLVEEQVATPEATDRGAVVGLRWKRGPFALMNELGLPEAHRLVAAYAQRWGDGFPVAAALKEAAVAGRREWPLKVVRVERHGAVAWVLLDRPEVLNSLNSAVLDQLDAAFASLEPATEIRCVVLAGSSPVFAAGADIAEMAGKDVASGRAFGFRGQAVCERIARLRAPVVALVEGYALGGGLELALAADFLIAAEGAKLGLPEVGIGIHPGFGGASRLSRQIGTARTKLLVFSGEPITAEAAERMGIVARVVAADTARAEVAALAEGIAAKAPLAVSWVKQVIDRGAEASLDAALRLEGESAAHTFGTEDRTEGMRAFLEGRRPKFTGR
ncbi:MAG TPA: enoyl-CoA hydratase-related protein [Thermoplasmata archaeon]|nr:enoyl-CoA hydratase-related protein [Thermoplasmata archaeon]